MIATVTNAYDVFLLVEQDSPGDRYHPSKEFDSAIR